MNADYAKESLKLVEYLTEALALLPKDEVLVSIEAANGVNLSRGCEVIAELSLMTIEIETVGRRDDGERRIKIYDVELGPKLILREV